MAPRPFLNLPCELRHKIYRFYFTTKKGYHFSPVSRKLTAADGKPIDLALMYTCRFIAEETKEMPFLYNDICFKTFYQKDLSLWLARFDRLIEAQFLQQLQLLIQLCPFITPEMHLLIGEKFPWFSTHLRDALVFRRIREWRSRFRLNATFSVRSLQVHAIPPDNYIYQHICSNDQAHSAHRAAIEFTLRILCETSDEQFIENVNDMLVGWEYSGGARLSNFLDRCYKPWRFPPSLCDLDEMGRRFEDVEAWSSINSWEVSRLDGLQYRPMYRFSAVSAAIGFLDDLPINKRASLRNMIIHEDRISEGYPDVHAIGLIPFCQENRRLRIRHKLSMVSNLLERAYFYEGSLYEIQHFVSDPNNTALLSLAAMNLYPIVSNCLAEAMYLPDAGMPGGSYTLVLDGEDGEDMCSEIFQKEVLRKEAQWLVISRALKAAPDSDWAHEMSYEIKTFFKAHSGALEHLVNKTSFLESNFHPGHLNNIDALMAYYNRIGMKACVAELYSNGSHDHVLTECDHAPDFTSMLMENFECRNGMTPEPTSERDNSREATMARLRAEMESRFGIDVSFHSGMFRITRH